MQTQLQMKRSSVGSAAVLALCTLLMLGMYAGCAHVKQTTPTPAPPPTPYQQVLAWNAAMAESNRIIAEGVINAHKVNRITTPEAGQILSVQFQIASWDKELTQILQVKDAGGPANTPRIQQLIGQIRDSANSLVQRNSIPIKDPATAAKVKVSIDSTFFLADLIIRGLVDAGVIPAYPTQPISTGGVPSTPTP